MTKTCVRCGKKFTPTVLRWWHRRSDGVPQPVFNRNQKYCDDCRHHVPKERAARWRKKAAAGSAGPPGDT